MKNTQETTWQDDGITTILFSKADQVSDLMRQDYKQNLRCKSLSDLTTPGP